MAEVEKVLTVKLDFHTPKFEFKGNWTGKDISTVSSHIRRAYLHHNLTIRRGEATRELTPQAEVSNERS